MRSAPPASKAPIHTQLLLAGVAVPRGPALGEDVYRHAITASYADLVHSPGTLTEMLVAPLLRVLRTRERYRSVFADPSVNDTDGS